MRWTYGSQSHESLAHRELKRCLNDVNHGHGYRNKAKVLWEKNMGKNKHCDHVDNTRDKPRTNHP
jgi:hypothetical protein